MIKITQCPICTGQSLSPIFTAIDYVVTQETFDILECDECHARLTNPKPGENQIYRYYESEDYIPHSESVRGLTDWIYGVTQRLMLRKKRKLIEKTIGSKCGRLLDVGCGTGEFLNTMHLAGWEVDGVDGSAFARERAKEKYGLIVQSSEQWFENRSSQYDVITFWHSLEHLHNLDEYLKKVASCLENDGLIIVGIPNYYSLDADYYQAEWAAYDVPRHLYHFTYDTMATLLDQYGLIISSTKGLPFDSFYVSLLSEKYTGGSLVRGAWVGLRSNLRALYNKNRWSSVIYFVTRVTDLHMKMGLKL